MKEVYELHLEQSEVDQAIKEYVIKLGYKPKKDAIPHTIKNTFGIKCGVTVALEKEIQGEK